MGNDTVKNGVFAATKKRVVFFSKKLFGFELESFPFRNISSIEKSKGLMGHSVTIHTSGNNAKMKWIQKGKVEKFTEFVNSNIGQGSQPTTAPIQSENDIPSQIKKISELFQQGILTEEEFSVKNNNYSKKCKRCIIRSNIKKEPMGKITNEIVEKAYEVAKDFYHERKRKRLKQAQDILVKNGMNENSAMDYIYNYSNLIQGNLFTRTTNAYGTDYYLKKIYEDSGQTGLQNALISLSQHIDYYEDKSGASVKKLRDIYDKYLKFLDKKPELTVYADEVDQNIKYAEGKTKTVLVNSYERNPVARQKCIEHYGVVCQVCSFNFEKVYGDIGKDFIHVHHKVDIATIGNEYSVDPINDLIPVCPNCHSMLHKKKPAYLIDELKQMMK